MNHRTMSPGAQRTVTFLDRLLSGRALFALSELDRHVAGDLPEVLSEVRAELLNVEEHGASDRLGDLLVAVHLGILRIELCIEQSPDPDCYRPVRDIVARIKEAITACELCIDGDPAGAV
jgi:hypothetical protein